MQGPTQQRARFYPFGRTAFVVVLAFGPAAVLAWVGCASSGSTSGSGLAVADPGGTYGAAVDVTVIGKGRVTASYPGISCPSSCFQSFVFDSASADGAAGGVTLTATTTAPNITFAGWSFAATPAGARGRGPDTCNPIMRPGAQPQLDTTAATITIPFGQTQGTAPAGQEAACSAFTTVPIAYEVTATFTEADAGVDAGGADVIYDTPVAGALGRGIGVASNNYLYWWWDQPTGGSRISYVPLTQIPQGSPQSAYNGSEITLFAVDAQIVFLAGGTLEYISAGSTFPTTLSGGAACVAAASDFSREYCRTSSGGLLSWTGSGLPTTLYTGLPSGTDLFFDTTTSAFFMSSVAAGSIISVSSIGTDGGAATPTTITTGITDPTQVRGNSQRLYWLDQEGAGQATAESSAKTQGSIYDNVTSATPGLAFIAVDPNNLDDVYVATSSSISRGSTFGGTLTSVRSGLVGIAGITVDSQYVYWIDQNARVYRAQKPVP